jgi:hypothetical protein
VDDTFYKEVAPNPAGEMVDFEWVVYPNTYTTFTGLWSPYKEGESSITLPDGVSSEDTIVINTTETLSTDDSSIGNESTGERIYLQNPEVNLNTHKYLVKKAAPWVANSSFQLIPSFNEYIAVRERAT